MNLSDCKAAREQMNTVGKEGKARLQEILLPIPPCQIIAGLINFHYMCECQNVKGLECMQKFRLP